LVVDEDVDGVTESVVGGGGGEVTDLEAISQTTSHVINTEWCNTQLCSPSNGRYIKVKKN